MEMNNKFEKDLKKFVAVKDGCIYKLEQCFDAKELYPIIQKEYDTLLKDVNRLNDLTYYEKNKLLRRIDDNYFNFNNWDLNKAVYNTFLRDAIVINDDSIVPTYEDICSKNKNFFNGKFWNFEYVFPEFKFGNTNNIQNTFILSMNECHSTYSNYIGTLDNFIKTFNELPSECIFIANNMNSKQQALLGSILAEGNPKYDGQGCTYMEGKYYWEVIYI